MHGAYWLTNHRARKLEKFKNFLAGIIVIVSHALALGQNGLHIIEIKSWHDSYQNPKTNVFQKSIKKMNAAYDQGVIRDISRPRGPENPLLGLGANFCNGESLSKSAAEKKGMEVKHVLWTTSDGIIPKEEISDTVMTIEAETAPFSLWLYMDQKTKFKYDSEMTEIFGLDYKNYIYIDPDTQTCPTFNICFNKRILYFFTLKKYPQNVTKMNPEWWILGCETLRMKLAINSYKEKDSNIRKIVITNCNHVNVDPAFKRLRRFMKERNSVKLKNWRNVQKGKFTDVLPVPILDLDEDCFKTKKNWNGREGDCDIYISWWCQSDTDYYSKLNVKRRGYDPSAANKNVRGFFMEQTAKEISDREKFAEKVLEWADDKSAPIQAKIPDFKILKGMNPLSDKKTISTQNLVRVAQFNSYQKKQQENDSGNAESISFNCITQECTIEGESEENLCEEKILEEAIDAAKEDDGNVSYVGLLKNLPVAHMPGTATKIIGQIVDQKEIIEDPEDLIKIFSILTGKSDITITPASNADAIEIQKNLLAIENRNYNKFGLTEMIKILDSKDQMTSWKQNTKSTDQTEKEKVAMMVKTAREMSEMKQKFAQCHENIEERNKFREFFDTWQAENKESLFKFEQLQLDAALLSKKLNEGLPASQPIVTGNLNKISKDAKKTPTRGKRRRSGDNEKIDLIIGEVEHPSKQPLRRSLRKSSSSKK